jgi:hypothetical protein
MLIKDPGVALLFSTLLLLSSCGVVDQDDDRCATIDEKLPCLAEALQVPDTTAAGDMIPARIRGVVGSDGCYHLESIERELVGSTWVLRPIAHHLELPGGACTYWVPRFDRVVALRPPHSGWAYIVVLSSGPALLDSTFVRPSRSAAQLGFDRTGEGDR